ncbi:rhodanese-like domain-containing protein [Maribacter sp.]|nr:rhodanese-like domain-containing protein [Maribacter sp.]
MRFFIYTLVLVVFSQTTVAQDKLARTLKKFNKESVPYVHVAEMTDTENVVLFDTRKKEEYTVSHLKNAVWVGHKKFEQDSVALHFPDKNTPIIVYCSIGVRSENIGEKLQKAGYTNVKNLYGGIFEWKNQGNPVYNSKTIETDSIHTFNKHWGKLLHQGIKVYDLPKATVEQVD